MRCVALFCFAFSELSVAAVGFDSRVLLACFASHCSEFRFCCLTLPCAALLCLLAWCFVLPYLAVLSFVASHHLCRCFALSCVDLLCFVSGDVEEICVAIGLLCVALLCALCFVIFAMSLLGFVFRAVHWAAASLCVASGVCLSVLCLRVALMIAALFCCFAFFSLRRFLPWTTFTLKVLYIFSQIRISGPPDPKSVAQESRPPNPPPRAQTLKV